MGILLCEQNFRDVWRRNKSVRGEIGKILRTHKHTRTHAAKLVVRIRLFGSSKQNGEGQQWPIQGGPRGPGPPLRESKKI